MAFKHLHPLLLSLLGFLIAYFCHKSHVVIPYWGANIGAGLSFFALGYWLNNCVEPTKKMKTSVSIFSLFIYGAWCVISCWTPKTATWIIPVIDMVDNRLFQGVYSLWYPVCLMGIFAFNKVTAMSSGGGLLEWIGKNAMLLFCTHYMLRYLVAWGAKHIYPTMTSTSLIVIILASYGLLMLVIKRFNKEKAIVKQ